MNLVCDDRHATRDTWYAVDRQGRCIKCQTILMPRPNLMNEGTGELLAIVAMSLVLFFAIMAAAQFIFPLSELILK